MFAGAQSLAQGIAGGAESIRQALDAKIEEAKREKQAGKAADAFFDSLEKPPMPYEFWDLKSPAEKRDWMVGTIGAQKYQQGAEDIKSQIAQRDFYNQKNAEMKAAIEREAMFNQRAMQLAGPPNREQMQAFYEGPDTMMPEERFRPTRGPITEDVILQAAAESGNLANPNTDNILSAIARAAQIKEGNRGTFFKPEDFGKLRPFTTPEGKVLPGAMGAVTGPNTSQVLFDPSTPIQTQTVKDPVSGIEYLVAVPSRGEIKVLGTGADFAKMALQDLYATKKDFRKQLVDWEPGSKEYQAIEAKIAEVDAQIKAKQSTKAAPAANLPTATNPQTGEKVVYKDGKWQPLK